MNEVTGTPPAKPGFLEQVASFPSTYWVANVIELVERFSFYGARVRIFTHLAAWRTEGNAKSSYTVPIA